MISFDVDEGLFRTYAFYTGVLVLKVLAMALLTGNKRFTKKVFANPEDTKFSRNSKIKLDDDDVERVRRAHLNDLENIPLFIIVYFAYLLTSPNVYIASNLLRSFVAGRIIHTIVYAVVVLPQPARALAFWAGYAPSLYMAVQVILFFL